MSFTQKSPATTMAAGYYFPPAKVAYCTGSLRLMRIVFVTGWLPVMFLQWKAAPESVPESLFPIVKYALSAEKTLLEALL